MQQCIILLTISLFIYVNRISGNAASDKNIHGTVSEQLKKTFAKSRWRVSYDRHLFKLLQFMYGGHLATIEHVCVCAHVIRSYTQNEF